MNKAAHHANAKQNLRACLMGFFIAVTLAFFGTFLIADQAEATSTDAAFDITFLDVGQGDAAIVQCDGQYMVVDGGDKSASSLMSSYLTRNGITELEYLVATHPNTDHTGGLPGVLQAAHTKRALSSVSNAKQDSFNDMKSRLTSQGTSIEVPQVGESFKLGSAQVTVVGPVYYTDDGNANNDSLMLKIEYGSTSILLTGDATDE